MIDYKACRRKGELHRVIFCIFFHKIKSNIHLLKNLVFFASGSGTNFQSVIDAIVRGDINARITGLITNKSGIKSIERAKKHTIPFKILHPDEFESAQKYENVLLEILAQWNPYLIILAGYLLKIPEGVIKHYEGKIINIHPSLLPKYGGKNFYGLNVHKAVIEGGEQESGCSVHVVTEEYDKGPILEQRKVPVYASDTAEKLAARVLEQEHQLLPEVVGNLVEDANYYN